MRLKKLASFGAEADDIHAPFQDIWEAFFASQVLVFRGVTLTPEKYLAFARRFGKPEPHVIDQFHYPGHPDILILSNVQKDGKPIGLADAGTYFHTDYSFHATIPDLAILRAEVLPTRGGDTIWSSGTLAYAGLSEALKSFVADLHALHEAGERFWFEYARALGDDAVQRVRSAFPGAVQARLRSSRRSLP